MKRSLYDTIYYSIGVSHVMVSDGKGLKNQGNDHRGTTIMHRFPRYLVDY